MAKMSNTETSRMNDTITRSRKSIGLAIFSVFRNDVPGAGFKITWQLI